MAGLGGSYRLEIGGQFEAQQQANARLALFGSLAIIAIVLLLYQCLHSWSAALQILVNVPLAAIGAVAMLLWFERPDASVFAGLPWWSWRVHGSARSRFQSLIGLALSRSWGLSVAMGF